MKKIMTALTLGALIGTAAFADVDINLGFRQRANLFYNAEHKDTVAGYKGLFNTDIYADNGTDSFTFGLSGDIAAFDAVFVSDEAATSKIRAKKAVGSLFLGNLTLQAGVCDDGLATGAYRVTSDGGNTEGLDFEWKKMGSGFNKSPSKHVDNKVMSVSLNDKAYFAGGTWKQKLSNGALDFNAFYITNENAGKATQTTEKADGEGSWQAHTLSFLVNYLNDDLGQAEAVFKVGQTNKMKDNGIYTAMAFGLYAQPKIIQELILTVGGAGSVVDSKFTDYSLDLRARYQILPKTLAATFFTSFSALTSDGETIVDNTSVRGIAMTSGDGNLTTMGMKPKDVINRDKLVANNLLIRYKPNGKINLIAVASNFIGFGKNQGLGKDDGFATAKGDDVGARVDLRFSGWAQFFATDSASITTGVVCSISDVANCMDVDGKATYWTWGVPMIFRVTF